MRIYTINQILRKIRTLYQQSTSFMRVVPDFIVVGTSFCGKTLLYNYIAQNRYVIENLREETGFFLDTHDRGFDWYKSNFSSLIYKKILDKISGKKHRIGETVNLPGYFVPKRVSEILSKPKIIIILRNPVERAYARYLAEIRNGNEILSFENSLEKEIELIKTHEINIIHSKTPLKFRHLFLYRLDGIYIEYLKQWRKFFPQNDIFIVKTEDLFNNPVETVNQCLNFLELPPISHLKNINKNFEIDSPKINQATQNNLMKFFQPYNKELYEFLEMDMGWEKL